MPNLALQPNNIPLSLYIHVPWCIKKCPYCDFNSHATPQQGLDSELENQYIHTLYQDFATQQHLINERPIHSIFIGGGTPSLLSAEAYQYLFDNIQKISNFQHFYDNKKPIEITLEANPATVEHDPFTDYLQAGINRLSLGVQSFHAEHLQKLGRIHTPDDAINAVKNAKASGFDRINIDLMHGLPNQGVEQALADLQMAIDLGVSHISWYQLTIEPNTVFYRNTPVLPNDDVLNDIFEYGSNLLKNNGFFQYEVSAWTKVDNPNQSEHNLNYWQFGDYLAIGAGAHGKISQTDGIFRYNKTRTPQDYLNNQAMIAYQAVALADLPFEFMMNALRLKEGVPFDFWQARTGLDNSLILPVLQRLEQQGLICLDNNQIACSEQGFLFLNQVLAEFLDDN